VSNTLPETETATSYIRKAQKKMFGKMKEPKYTAHNQNSTVLGQYKEAEITIKLT